MEKRDTHGLFADVVECVGCCVNDLALDLVCPTTIVSQAAGAGGDIDIPGHAERLAIVQSFNGGEEISILLEEFGKLEKKLSTVLGCLLPPWTIEGFTGSSNGDVDVLLRGLLNLANDFFGRRIDDIEGLAVNSLDELVVDEPCEYMSKQFGEDVAKSKLPKYVGSA